MKIYKEFCDNVVGAIGPGGDGPRRSRNPTTFKDQAYMKELNQIWKDIDTFASYFSGGGKAGYLTTYIVSGTVSYITIQRQMVIDAADAIKAAIAENAVASQPVSMTTYDNRFTYTTREMVIMAHVATALLGDDADRGWRMKRWK